ncbi:actin-like ATPase domain-containing protein [Aaosphaeria arxii CBS 175.79]|uniref:Actin-like ATPase domain-containing protein n=1 Tax=Aaosphaeria arxii CBS 175.79 TaxID=1450172 RepID=A0A6A5Y8L7_9PLEO|nr:actin-like ATPase domain-containing protein [Aaosphaeria arxii CBS 175.79]KAF2021357.1 actin-like ATPase domain-containing protein [Aaosphaeria arxii CBS 175.79]
MPSLQMLNINTLAHLSHDIPESPETMVPTSRHRSRRRSSRLSSLTGSPSLSFMILIVFTCGLALVRPAQTCAFDRTIPPTIGISFGNTYSSVVYDVNKTTTYVPDKDNQTFIPTCVAFTETGEPFIGTAAKRQLSTHPERTVCNFRNLLLNKTDDLVTRTYEVVDNGGFPLVRIPLRNKVKTFHPEEIAGIFFQGLKDMMQEYTKKKAHLVLVSAGPADDYDERDVIKRALEIGGINESRVVRDGILGAIAYNVNGHWKRFLGWNQYEEGWLNVLTYDIGASSFRVTVMEAEDGVYEVLGESKDNWINGNAIDRELVDYVTQLHPALKEVESSILTTEMERVKKVLSSNDTAQFTFEIPSTGQTIQDTLSRDAFNLILAPYIPKIISHIDSAIHAANLTIYDIGAIIPIGGTLNIPALTSLLTHHFPPTTTIHDSIPPESVIHHGLRSIARNMDTDEYDGIVGNFDTSRLSLGVRTAGDIASPVVFRVYILPASVTRYFTTTHDDQSRAVIEMYEGDRATVANNTVVARIEVDGIPPAKRGVPQIAVTISLHDYTAGNYTFNVALTSPASPSITEGEQGPSFNRTLTGNLRPLNSTELTAIFDDLDANIAEDEVAKAGIQARLAKGEVEVGETDVVAVGDVWWDGSTSGVGGRIEL